MPRGGRGPRPLYLCFLNLRKAFNTVPRDIIFLALFDAGITGKILRVIQDFFSSNRANVLIGGYLSRTFQISTEVLQGRKLGSVLFILFIISLLSSLRASKQGAAIGQIHISTLGFVDDIVLISDSPAKLQKLISICEIWANTNRMEFNLNNSHFKDVLIKLPFGCLLLIALVFVRTASDGRLRLDYKSYSLGPFWSTVRRHLIIPDTL